MGKKEKKYNYTLMSDEIKEVKFSLKPVDAKADLNKSRNEVIMKVAKDMYLIWAEHANITVWRSYPLWTHLSDDEKNFWYDFVIETFKRYSTAKI